MRAYLVRLPSLISSPRSLCPSVLMMENNHHRQKRAYLLVITAVEGGGENKRGGVEPSPVASKYVFHVRLWWTRSPLRLAFHRAREGGGTIDDEEGTHPPRCSEMVI